MNLVISGRKVEIEEQDTYTLVSIDGFGQYSVPKECVYVLKLNSDKKDDWYYIAVVSGKDFIEIETNKLKRNTEVLGD